MLAGENQGRIGATEEGNRYWEIYGNVLLFFKFGNEWDIRPTYEGDKWHLLLVCFWGLICSPKKLKKIKKKIWIFLYIHRFDNENEIFSKRYLQENCSPG